MKKILGSILTTAAIVSLVSCSGSGTGNDDAGKGSKYVDNGGSGSTIKLEVPSTVNVADRAGFFVRLRDPKGLALSGVRIYCDTERGLAILEPAAAGVAYETTDSSGNISGAIGGLANGSFIMECRAPQGYNLVARETVKVQGPVPLGFIGFPGAAGGGLGGGVVVVPPDGTGARITLVGFTTVLSSPNITYDIDNPFETDCNGDGTSDDPESFGPDRYSVTIANSTSTPILVGRVTINVRDTAGNLLATIVDNINNEIAPGAASTATGLFTDSTGGLTGFAFNVPNVSLSPLNGSYTAEFVVDAENLEGQEFSLEATTSFRIYGIDGCTS